MKFTKAIVKILPGVYSNYHSLLHDSNGGKVEKKTNLSNLKLLGFFILIFHNLLMRIGRMEECVS